MTNQWIGVVAFFGTFLTSFGASVPASAPVGPASSAIGAVSNASRAAPTSGYVWPLTPRPEVIRGFEAPPQPWAAGHRGVDLKGSKGQTVRAAGGGIVAFSGVIAGRGVVAIQHPDGRRTTYEPVDRRDPKGTVEAAGDPIGVLAAGGHCGSTPCLHWGLLVGKDQYRNPLDLIQIRRVRLLPLG